MKTRVVRLGIDGLGAARAHLRYIQRDGVQRDGSPGMLYSGEEDRADGRLFLERCNGDRHQFRLIVSAEDGDQYSDLKPLIRRLMTGMEQDLETKLEWIAADHADTAQPHSHIVLRGRDESGKDLIIAREYILHGIRERAVELVALDLGPRQDFEIQQRERRDLGAERLTVIDHALLQDRQPDATVGAGHRDPFWHSLRVGRLKRLEAMGLAEHLGSGRWRLADDLEGRLRRMGDRRNIIRTMQRELAAARLERSPADRLIHETALPVGGIVGRVIARGYLDEQSDRQFLIFDGVDGRAHLIDIGSGESIEPLPVSAIIRVSTDKQEPTVQALQTRVEILSPLPLERLADWNGATWLDRQLDGEAEPLRDSGFGREVRSALALRRQWLLAQGLANDAEGGFAMEPGALAALQTRELSAVAARLSNDLGLPAHAPEMGERVAGNLRQRIDLASGRFGLVESPSEFALIPWQPEFERQLGRKLSGMAGPGGFAWSLSHLRGIEID